jgi:hypothetical protein
MKPQANGQSGVYARRSQSFMHVLVWFLAFLLYQTRAESVSLPGLAHCVHTLPRRDALNLTEELPDTRVSGQ